MGELIERLKQSWAVRSLMVGALSTVLDLSILFLGVEVLGLPRVPCVLAGVSVGGVLGFVLNKHFAFRDDSRRVGAQATKYAALVATELSLHTGLSSALIHGAHLHYLAAKFSADFVVFTCIHLLALRYLVFNRQAPQVQVEPPAAT